MCQAGGYQMDLPLLQNNNMAIPESQDLHSR